MPAANVFMMILIATSTSDMAELTDKGRQTTLNLGRRLRHLYIHQLGSLPDVVSDPNMIYLRSSPFPRALDSLQQAFTGLYPAEKRHRAFPRPTIVTRRLIDETLMPNEIYCERFVQLTKAYSKRAANQCKSSSNEKCVSYYNQMPKNPRQGTLPLKWITSTHSSRNGCHPNNVWL